MLLQYLRNLGRKVKSKNVSWFSTYYDSQSGRYMNIPGTQSLRLHDVTKKVESSLPISPGKLKDSCFLDFSGNKLNENVKKVTSQSLISKFYFPGQAYESIRVQSIESKSNYEFDCLEHLGQSQLYGLASIESRLTQIRSMAPTELNIRVNVAIDISTLISDGRASESILSIVTTVGKLCDMDVEVVNLVFCQSHEFDDDLLDRLDDVVDYVREIIEECNGLDVPGAAVIDRLSVQACHSDILDVAKSLGVRRFAVLDKASKGSIQYMLETGSTFCSIDDPRNYEY